MFTDHEPGFLGDFVRKFGRPGPDSLGPAVRLVAYLRGCRGRNHDPDAGEPDHVARLRHADESDTGASDWVGECPQPRNRKLTGNTLFSSTYGYMVGLACGYKAGSVTPCIFRRRLSSSTNSEVIFAIDFCP